VFVLLFDCEWLGNDHSVGAAQESRRLASRTMRRVAVCAETLIFCCLRWLSSMPRSIASSTRQSSQVRNREVMAALGEVARKYPAHAAGAVDSNPHVHSSS
jgi:hypothetical protein